jgi:crotonobetainyl-CoA:carnitine CoA-transferase CaiB-like acyl-CoA transferase
MVDSDPKPKMALAGLRVICFGMGGAAPLATATLADFGAEVVKVEPPGGDWSRTTPGLGTREFNRNKKGIAIDLKHPDGIALAKRLVRDADAVMESFRPGVMDRLGLGYEAVRAVNPRVVYCSVTGYGQTGPWKDRPGVDGVIQAISGMMSVLGPDETEHPGEVMDPIKVPFPVVDMTAGLLAAQGMLLALLARERHGMGQHVDVSLLESALVLQKSSLTRYLSTGKLPPKTGSRAPYATPNQAFRTSDGHIMVAAYTPARWQAFCRNVLGRPEIETDPRFATRQTRQEHHTVLREIVESVFRRRSSAELLRLCEENDLVCAAINSYDEVVQLEQVKARGSIGKIRYADGRELGTVTPAPRLSETPGSVRRPYPEFIGLHTREVLLSIGLDEAEIARLAAAGAIGVHRDTPQ